eukprot:2885319-Amphidinium_carterae.1
MQPCRSGPRITQLLMEPWPWTCRISCDRSVSQLTQHKAVLPLYQSQVPVKAADMGHILRLQEACYPPDSSRNSMLDV